jgi:hypothetical protein
VRLMIIFLGLYHDTFGEIPMILEEYGLITQQEMDELYEYEIYAPTVRPRAEITGGGSRTARSRFCCPSCAGPSFNTAGRTSHRLPMIDDRTLTIMVRKLDGEADADRVRADAACRKCHQKVHRTP